MYKSIMLMPAALLAMLIGCSGEKVEPQSIELKHYAMDNLSELLTQDNIEFDGTVSSDGLGSVKIIAAEPTTVRLFETGDIDAEDAKLLYRAKLKTADFEGQVFLEMWCVFENTGEYFARDLESPVSGSVDWSSEEIFFMLEKGQNPSNVKLNLVINGTGTVWVDDISLIKASLPQM